MKSLLNDEQKVALIADGLTKEGIEYIEKTIDLDNVIVNDNISLTYMYFMTILLLYVFYFLADNIIYGDIALKMSIFIPIMFILDTYRKNKVLNDNMLKTSTIIYVFDPILRLHVIDDFKGSSILLSYIIIAYGFYVLASFNNMLIFIILFGLSLVYKVYCSFTFMEKIVDEINNIALNNDNI